MTRPVTVFKLHRDEGEIDYRKVPVGAGLFHQFGSDFEEFENGGCVYSTAIVEMPDGTVQNVPVEMVRFDDEEQGGGSDG